jgi:hypothetical protein
MLTCILLALTSLPGAWGTGGTAAGSGWSPALAPAMPFASPAPFARVLPAPTPRPGYTPAELDAAVERVLARRKARSHPECVGSCACNRCPDGCKCRQGGGRCGDGCSCVLADDRPLAEGTTNFGVDRSKMLDGRPCYRRAGKGGVKEISRDEALKLLEGKDVPDDAGKRRLTVIADEAKRKAFDAWWKGGDAAAYRDHYLVQLYAEDDWHVEHGGFVKPAVYLQAADGLVLHRQADPGDVEALKKALYRASPDYDPAKDPDLSKAPPKVPVPDWAKPFAEVHPLVYALAGVALILYLTRKKE